MIINDLFNNKKPTVAESMAGKVVFSGTGADGGTYEIIQSGPTDFMIHANGKHIDAYGSLQRAMSVLKNEVPGLQQGMAEGKADYNFDIEDLKRLEQIRDLATLKAQALELISKPSAKPMKPEKVEWFRNALERMNSPLKVIKLMYDLLLSGEGKAVVGTRSSMNPNTYRQRFGEQGMAEGKKPEHIDETEDLSMYDPKIQQAVKSGRLDLADAAWMNDYYKTPGDSRLETGKGAFKDQSQKMQNFVDRMKSGEIPVHSQFKDTMELRGTVARQAKQGGGMGGGGGMGKRPGDLDNKFNPLKLENVIDKQGMAENNAVNVPPGWQATTQPDGSTRISKPGSVSRADYAKNMAAYKAQTQTPEKIADFKQRMASGQGYTDTERQANLQQQQQHFGKFADTGDLDEDAYDPFANDPAADAKHEAEVRARMQQQLKQGKGTSLKDMPSIDRDQYLKNTNRTWDEKTQRSVPATKPNVQEVSLGDYRKKATMSKAMAQTNKFFDRDNPAKVAAADRTIANRTKGLAGADARSRPYTAPPVDQDKQRRDLADKYPNIDELVRQAELRRDPQYDRADGPAYYDGRDAEHNYHRLKQIQRMIRGAELDEMDFSGVNQTTDSTTGDVTTNFNQGPMSVSQTKTPGGYTKQTDQQFNLGIATLGARTVGPNIGAGQLAGTTTKTATNNMTGQAKQQVKGVGFGGASGATVGKNYVGASDDELAKVAADSVTGINEEPNQATVNVPGSSFSANKSTNAVSGQTNIGGATLSATKNITPGGGGSVSASMQAAPNLNITATQKSADYNKGQLAGTKSVSAKYTDTTGALGKPGQQHTATRTAGVGFGGATGANVGKNYVDQYSVNESVDRIKHLAGIKQSRV